MYIALENILENHVFESATVLAGKSGLKKKVNRVTVFDCPLNLGTDYDSILMEGDIFITCLEQFGGEDQNVDEFIRLLVGSKAAGILMITEDNISCLTDESYDICNENGLPLVLLKEDIPYAVLMDTINKYISIDNLNAMNMLKLDKIINGDDTVSAKMKLLDSINPNIKKYIRVLDVLGTFNSELTKISTIRNYISSNNDIFVDCNDHMTLIISEEDEKKLQHHFDVTISKIKDDISEPVLGYSRVFLRKEISQALEESKKALTTAETMGIKLHVYDPISSLQLMLSLRDTKEAEDYYNAYVAAIGSKVSSENLIELMRTIETYVANNGSYQKTAMDLKQHENTIRYRVNKVKEALNMEDDTIHFHETIAIASKLRVLLGK